MLHFTTIWNWHPPVGVFIAILAVLGVLVPFIREKVGRREKAIWSLVLVLLLGFELKSIYQDRNEHDKQQADARQSQLEGFRQIGDGIKTAIQNSQNQFDATMQRSELIFKGVRTSIDTITGGDSFVYLTFGRQPDGRIVISANHAGKFPLHNVEVRITNLKEMDKIIAEAKRTGAQLYLPLASDINVKIGDISAHVGRAIWWLRFDNSDRQDYNVFFYGQNGLWSQLIRMRLQDNQWITATKVLGSDGRKVLYEKIDPKFPRKAGRVQWDTQ